MSVNRVPTVKVTLRLFPQSIRILPAMVQELWAGFWANPNFFENGLSSLAQLRKLWKTAGRDWDQFSRNSSRPGIGRASLAKSECFTIRDWVKNRCVIAAFLISLCYVIRVWPLKARWTQLLKIGTFTRATQKWRHSNPAISDSQKWLHLGVDKFKIVYFPISKCFKINQPFLEIYLGEYHGNA